MIRPVRICCSGCCHDARTPPPEYPFVVGETLSYSAKLGMITLGLGQR